MYNLQIYCSVDTAHDKINTITRSGNSDTVWTALEWLQHWQRRNSVSHSADNSDDLRVFHVKKLA